MKALPVADNSNMMKIIKLDSDCLRRQCRYFSDLWVHLSSLRWLTDQINRSAQLGIRVPHSMKASSFCVCVKFEFVCISHTLLSERLWGCVPQHPSSSQWPPWGHYGNWREAAGLSGGTHEAVIGLVLWQTLSFNSSSIYYCWDSRCCCWLGWKWLLIVLTPTPNNHLSSCLNTHMKMRSCIPLTFKYYLYVLPERPRLAGPKPVNIITTVTNHRTTVPRAFYSLLLLFCILFYRMNLKNVSLNFKKSCTYRRWHHLGQFWGAWPSWTPHVNWNLQNQLFPAQRRGKNTAWPKEIWNST